MIMTLGLDANLRESELREILVAMAHPSGTGLGSEGCARRAVFVAGRAALLAAPPAIEGFSL